MSTKVELRSSIEPSGVQTSVTVNASAAASSSSKISMFTAKSGFVIPKNKLSGSLVPIFRGSKKPGGSDAVNDESTKQVQRKTKWGPDLTQDAGVRKGRALAYQTRVDQITKQLSLGILETGDNQHSLLAAEEPDQRSSVPHNKSEESKLLELEQQEVIGEILKLNPSYKAPPDYKPSLKEAKVPVPIKQYPGYNFIGIIFDPASDTQKRLEKETGAKIRVYGTKAVTGEKVEITPSDGNEALGGYEELYVQISADTYEKVDAAVALIEMVVTPVSVNPSAISTASPSVSADNATVVDQSPGTPTPYTTPPIGVNQEAANSVMGSVQTSQGQFQPYPGPWFAMGPPQTPARPPSGFVFPPNPSASILTNPVQPSSSPFSPSHMPSPFGPRPFPPQNPSLVLSRPQPPGLQRPFMLQGPPFGQFGPPPNPQPGISAPPPFIGNQPSSTGHAPNARPLGPSLSQPMSRPTSGPVPDRPLNPQMVPPQGLRPGTSQPASGAPLSNFSTMNMVSPVPAPAPMSGPRPLQSSSPIAPNPFTGFNPIAPPVATTSTPPQPASQGGIPSSLSGSASFTPINPPSLAAPKPQHPNSSDFTFQPHWPQNSVSQGIPRPGIQPMMQNIRPPNPAAPPPQLPQTPSFRPAIHPSSPQPVMQGNPRPHVINQMNHPHSHISPFPGNPTGVTSAPLRNPAFPNPTPVAPNSLIPQMGMRNLNPTPYPPRSGMHMQIPQNFPAAAGRPQSLLLAPNQHLGSNMSSASGRPAFGPGAQQFYDPFSPSSVHAPPLRGGDPSKMRKQESDPEYEDLMASVGVK